MDIHELLRHRPQWLYEASPYLYGLCGVMVLIMPNAGQLHSMLITCSGIALLAASTHVFAMRWHYRRKNDQGNGDHEAALVAIIWDRSKESDNLEFNKLNKQLFVACQHLIEDAQKAPLEDLKESIEQTIELIRYSFGHTENVLHELNPQQSQALHQTHQAILKDVVRRYREFNSGKVRRKDLIAFLVYRVVVERVKLDAAILNDALWA